MDTNVTKKNEKQNKKNRYFMVKEKNDNRTQLHPEDLKNKKKRKSEEIIKLKPKKLHKEKKKVVSELKNLHEILEKTKPPDEEELKIQEIVFGDSVDDFGEDIEIVDRFKNEKKEIEPAWVDEDDENMLIKEKTKSYRNIHQSVIARGEEKYSSFLQEKFIKIHGEPEWARLNSEPVHSDDDIDDELRKTGNLEIGSESLPRGLIIARKCPSLTHENMNGASIKSVEFHPTSRVALVAGSNGIVNLFQVDGKLNSKIQSIYLENFPIHMAHFTTDGNEIVSLSNLHGFFYTYDMFTGKVGRVPWQKGMEQKNIRRFCMSPDGKFIVIHGRYGNIHLVTSKTKEWIGTLKSNGEVTAISFNKDGSKMFSHGSTGEVYIWDVNSRKCIHKFTDEGCINGTCVAVSANNQFLATGSDSGIVNIYDCSSLHLATPCPVKVIKNLTTEINTLKFNATSEILAISSSYKIGAARLVHCPSFSVIANFPSREEYKLILNPNCIDFSPLSGYMMLGNNVGRTLIYRLKHFRNY